MQRRLITSAIAVAALAVAAPVAAKPGAGNGGANANAGIKANVNAGGPSGAALDARVNSKGALNASPTGVAKSNANSVLKNGIVTGGSLTGLTTGMHVVDANGTMIGTVSKILTTSDGRVVNVLVTPHEGNRTIPMSPDSLSVSGGVVTTTKVKGKI
ncbi:MAG: PRC-barrel domain-containing protein [Alphaproteobacteria bacterium]